MIFMLRPHYIIRRSKYRDGASMAGERDDVYSAARTDCGKEAAMLETNVGALALLLMLGGVRADAPAAPGESAPRLQITRMSGKADVELGDRGGEAASRDLPYLKSGATVRVRSGFAVFDSDYHATVRAAEGDEFQFLAIKPEGSRSGTLRIAATGKEPRTLEISVGGRKFRLRKGGAISVTSVWPGEMIVRSEGRGAQLAPGSLAGDGSILSAARRLAPGDAMTVIVPESAAFENEAIDLARLSVSLAGDRGFAVASSRPAASALLAREAEARRVLSDWPVISQTTAEAIIEKYGPPDLAIPDRLSWYDNSPWKITTVYRNPFEHIDVLEQTIGYTVPQDKAPALAKLDVALRLSRDRRELSATSESEETNFLALNLADEVVRERKSPEEARAFYLKTVLQWNAGKSSPYLKELRFR